MAHNILAVKQNKQVYNYFEKTILCHNARSLFRDMCFFSDNHSDDVPELRVDKIFERAQRRGARGITESKRTRYYGMYFNYFSRKKPTSLFKFVKNDVMVDTLKKEYLYFNHPEAYNNGDSDFIVFKEGPHVDISVSLNEELSKIGIKSNKLNNDIDKYVKGNKIGFDELRNKVLTCCLCECSDLQKMWSKYAGGDGICIEVDTSKVTLNSYPLYYGIDQDRSEMLWQPIKDQVYSYSKKMKEQLYYSSIANWLLCIYSRDKKDAYECEWRYIWGDGGTDDHKYYVPGAFLKVYLNQDYENTETYGEIIDLCNSRGLSYQYI